MKNGRNDDIKIYHKFEFHFHIRENTVFVFRERFECRGKVSLFTYVHIRSTVLIVHYDVHVRYRLLNYPYRIERSCLRLLRYGFRSPFASANEWTLKNQFVKIVEWHVRSLRWVGSTTYRVWTKLGHEFNTSVKLLAYQGGTMTRWPSRRHCRSGVLYDRAALSLRTESGRK